MNGTHRAYQKAGQKLMVKVAESRWRRLTISRRSMSPKPKQKQPFNFDIQSSCSIRAVWQKTKILIHSVRHTIEGPERTGHTYQLQY